MMLVKYKADLVICIVCLDSAGVWLSCQTIIWISGLSWVFANHVTYVTVFWKTDHLRTRTEIHVLPVHDRHTHALSRNTKHWTIDSQVCFYRRLFIDAVKPRGCISWPWGASMGLHGVPGCSCRQSWPPLCILTVCATD